MSPRSQGNATDLYLVTQTLSEPALPFASMRSIIALFVAAALFLSGCAGGGDETGGTGDGSTTSDLSTSGHTTGPTTTKGTTSSSSSKSPQSGDNKPPTATLSVSTTSGPPPLAVNFTVGGVDPDGDAIQWSLDYGDGSVAASGNALPKDVSHAFTAAGNFTVKLTVTDSKGAAGDKMQVITVSAGAAEGPQVTDGDWTAGGPVSCEQFADGDDLNKVLTPFEGIEFVTFDIRADTANALFYTTVTPTVPAAGPFEIDFYDAGGANLGYFQSSDAQSFDIPGTVPAGAVTAVFFACTAGGGSFTYTAPGAAP